MKDKTKKHGNTKYTDEELIEWIKTFNKRDDMKCDLGKYSASLRRGLGIYFPPKRTRGNNIVGDLKKQVYEERLRKRLLRDEERKQKKERKKTAKVSETKSKRDQQGTLYPTIYVDGIKTCPRCRKENKFYQSLCKPCNNDVARLKKLDQDTSLGNVKDSYCRCIINLDGGEKIEIEYNVSKEQAYRLRLEGFGFILKAKN
ncbi:hypothetical protein UFOVP182_31 [uncultured Caudovirales phage]|uniref:Uncharacterized protein n=1 Tax=uncultured Caudovirales phage TaxID=2100421 RepID=A0A6J7WDG6_9CAUD|nr:hypothetical protein UFOVP182_31 [uncultured Caudovirales phage]